MPFKPSSAIETAARSGHQGDGVRERLVGGIALGVALAAPLIMVCVWLQFKAASGERYRGLAAPTLIAPQSQPRTAMPEPQLIVVSGAGLAELRAREDAELATYGWIDRQSNIVRIPIQRAMELIAQRGWPADASNVNTIGKSEYNLILERSQQRQETPIKETK